jgi:hypothetical protein
MTFVGNFFYILWGNRLPKTRPPGSGVVLCIGREELIPATNTYKRPVTFEIVVFSGERALGTGLSRYPVLFLGQYRAPLVIRFYYFFRHVNPVVIVAMGRLIALPVGRVTVASPAYRQDYCNKNRRQHRVHFSHYVGSFPLRLLIGRSGLRSLTSAGGKNGAGITPAPFLHPYDRAPRHGFVYT